MSFSSPFLLWGALAAPIISWIALHVARSTIERHASWVRRALWERIGFRPRARRLHAILLGAAVLFAFLTLARPRWGESEQIIEQRGIDMVFVLDSSLSMAAEDLTPNRLAVAKSVIRRLARAAPGHRIGLVQAEGDGYVLAPLTFDAAIIDLLLDTVEVATLPKPGTQLSRALAVALDLFDESALGSQVLVLVSDGEDHGRDLEAVAAELRRRGVIVLAGGVGSTRGVPLPVPGGRNREFKRDASGEVVVSKLLEASLEQLARATGGVYRRFDDPAADLGPFEDAITALERQRRERLVNSRLEERFQWPLLATVLCLAGLLLDGPLGSRD